MATINVLKETWFDVFFGLSPLFHLFIVSTGMVQVCEHVTCLDPCSWKPHDPNMSIRYREPSPGTETEEEPWVYKVTSSTTKGNLNVSAGSESDSDPTNSSHPPTKTKIKLFSFIECTKKFQPKVFRLQSIQCNYHIYNVGSRLWLCHLLLLSVVSSVPTSAGCPLLTGLNIYFLPFPDI